MKLGASFRDPAGFVFRQEGVVKRAVTRFGAKDLALLMRSGLYGRLTSSHKMISHQTESSHQEGVEAVLLPQQIPVITYPYEWCFSQFKDAALLTLDIQLEAMECGMSLKDASPYNVQFVSGAPIFIDTLSFEELKERPWPGYRQFCEMFLAPLALMAHRKADFNKGLRTELGGFDLDLVSRLLPKATWLDPGCLAHIHLHALSQSKFKAARAPQKNLQASVMPKVNLVSLLRSLRSFTQALSPKKEKTAFSDYYGESTHYSNKADVFKADKVRKWSGWKDARLALDLGGNTGKFSRILTENGLVTVCADSDAQCVEENYLLSKKNGDKRMLPLVLDLANPPGDLGWDGKEREAFFKRVKPDLVLGLALIHHLRMPGGISMEFLASFFAGISPRLVIEFVPKGDPMVERLLENREDCFHDYTPDSFEAHFGRHFEILERSEVPDTHRTLYHLRRKGR